MKKTERPEIPNFRASKAFCIFPLELFNALISSCFQDTHDVVGKSSVKFCDVGNASAHFHDLSCFLLL